MNNIFKSEIAKVVGSVTHEPYSIKVGGVELSVPRPRLRQILLIEKHFSSLPDTKKDASYMDMITHTAECGKLAMVASILLTGEEDKSVAKEIEDKWTIQDAIIFVQEVLMRDGDVESFFVFTTSLKRQNLLTPTKEVETASGL